MRPPVGPSSHLPMNPIFQRQILVWGTEGQQKLASSRVLILGVGGLGCASAAYLALAGIGKLILVDSDHVDLSNIQRQFMYGIQDVGKPKVEVAKNFILSRNPHVDLETHWIWVDVSLIQTLMAKADIVLDCTDNFRTRYLVHDACFLNRKRLIQASVYHWDGTLVSWSPPYSSCLRCLYPFQPRDDGIQTCEELGVVNVVPGILGMHQALECIHQIVQGKATYPNTLRMFDGRSSRWRNFDVPRNPSCLLCGTSSIQVLSDIDYPLCPSARPSLGWEDVLKHLEEVIVVDLRPHADPPIPAAHVVHFPWDQRQNWDLTLLKNSKLKAVVCETGHKSPSVCLYLRGHGIEHAKSVLGGTSSLGCLPTFWRN